MLAGSVVFRFWVVDSKHRHAISAADILQASTGATHSQPGLHAPATAQNAEVGRRRWPVAGGLDPSPPRFLDPLTVRVSTASRSGLRLRVRPTRNQDDR